MFNYRKIAYLFKLNSPKEIKIKRNKKELNRNKKKLNRNKKE